MAVRRKLEPTQSPVVSAAVARKQLDTKASSALKYSSSSLLGTLLFAVDMQLGILTRISSLPVSYVWCAELVLTVVLLLVAVYNTAIYLYAYLGPHRIRLTAEQKKLLAVSDSAPGFDTVPVPVSFGTPVGVATSSPPTSPLKYLSPSTPFSTVYSTPHAATLSYNHTPTPTSFTTYRSPTHPMLSPFAADKISDHHSLETYLRSEEEREQWTFRGSPDVGVAQLRHSRNPLESPTPSLRKYHVATRSQSPSHGDSDSPLGRDGDLVWARIGMKRDDLDRWTENCRKWLAQTVLGPLAQEVDTINSTLCKIGCGEFQIGVSSTGTLKELARTKIQHVPTLKMVLSYLEVSSKQEYIVQRIKELAKGSCISAYRWNSGGTWKGRDWDQDLPSDAQMVMHVLCTYLDSHMPNPRFPDGRTFSLQYFIKHPDKPDLKKTDVHMCIYQASIDPPHFKILTKEGTIEVPKGRNNLFHAIVVFLHYIKTHENSMLGQINLELCGVNILWIVNDD